MPSPLPVGPAVLALLIGSAAGSVIPARAAEPSPAPAPAVRSAAPAPRPSAPLPTAPAPTAPAPGTSAPGTTPGTSAPGTPALGTSPPGTPALPAPSLPWDASIPTRSAGPVLTPIGGPAQAALPRPSSGLPTGGVLPGSGAGKAQPEVPGAPLDPDAVKQELAPLLTGGVLGRGRTPSHVVDVATGRVLYSAAQRPTIPASTTKLVTAAAALAALGPDAVLRTRVQLRSSAAAVPRVVLVGAGDPSLSSTGARVGGTGTSVKPASMARLARATARALAARGITKVRVRFDDSAFSGPAVHPSWPANFPAIGAVAPVSALQVDQGRFDPRGFSRVPDPAARAAAVFSSLLERQRITVSGNPTRVASGSGAVLASVASPSIAVLVERMLATSDNDYAEALARVAAAADGHQASFAGVAKHAPEVLRSLGVDPTGGTFADGSGLSRRNLLPPRLLTDLLRATAERFGPVSSGLPVAGATGSLRDRYDAVGTVPARGVVRAKTGTLTGVVGLAGYASRPDGRLLAFAFLDDRLASGTLGSRGAVDRAVAALVACDCATSGSQTSGSQTSGSQTSGSQTSGSQTSGSQTSGSAGAGTTGSTRGGRS